MLERTSTIAAQYQAVVVLYNVLPQIVAVIEAAENANTKSQGGGFREGHDGWRTRLDATLAALEQALTNPQGKD